MFRKFLLNLFIILIAVQLVGCGNASTTSSEGDNNTNSQKEPQTDIVILDNEKIAVTYQGVIDMPDIGYFYVNLKIENKMDKEIWVTLESGDVDGETIPLITTGAPVYIRSGNSYAATFGFPTMNLSINSVKDAKEATFKLVVRDKENIMDTIFESELITIELNR